MTALPPVPKVVRVDLHQNLGEDLTILNRIFFQYATALSQADCDTFAAHVVTEWSAHMRARFQDDQTLDFVEVTDLSSDVAPRSVSIANLSGSIVGGTPVPGATCFVTRAQIARRYRGGKPKTFWAMGQGESLSDEQRWDASFVTASTAAVGAFVAGVASGAPAGMGTVLPVSVSYFEGFTVVTSPITGRARNVPTLRATPVVDEILGYVGDPRPGSQRRRNLMGR